MRLATFNVENLFERFSIMNLPSWSESRKVLQDFGRLSDLIQKQEYSQYDKDQMLDIMKRNQGLLTKGESRYIVLNDIRGKLLKKDAPAKIIANGREDWIGWFELKREPINEAAIQNAGRVISSVNADILCLIEIDSRDAIIRFNDSVIPKVSGGQKYDNVSHTGNDVGIMTRSSYHITSEASHVDDTDKQGRIFSGDCVEYVIKTPSRKELVVLVNHFKSKYGSPEENDLNLRRQAERVQAIYEERLKQGFEFIAIAGDLNEVPDRDPLKVLLSNSNLVDIMNHNKFEGDNRPGTYGNGTKDLKLDYLLMSPRLANSVKLGGIERHGVWAGKNGSLFPHFAEIMTAKDAASNHAALWADLEFSNYKRKATKVEQISKQALEKTADTESKKVKADPSLIRVLGEPSTHVITDTWTLKDALGYRVYAHAIARFITHSKTVPPLCVSIQAPWGQGKTSLMRMIQEELDQDAVKESLKETPNAQLQRKIKQHKVNLQQMVKGTHDLTNKSPGQSKIKRSYLDLEEIVKTELEEPSEFKSLQVHSNKEEEVERRITIWFNAWAYESTEQVWSGLADSIVQQIAERLDEEESMRFLLGLHIRRHGIDKIIQRINDRVSTKWWHNTRSKMKKYVPLIGVSSVITTLGWVDRNEFWPIAGLSGLVGSVIAGGLQIFQERAKAELSVESESAQECLGEYVDVPDYSKSSAFMSQVIEDIQTILKRVPRMYLPMVIFIDDLDRCSPNKVTDIVEAINLFLGGGYFSNCMFVIGIDAEMVAAALEESYSKVIDRLPQYPLNAATGWKFMDKFVQLPFVIPRAEPSQLDNYVRKLFLQDKIQNRDVKQMQVNEAAKEVAREIIKESAKDGKVEAGQSMKNAPEIDQITKIVAEKHGLGTDQDQELLKDQVEERMNVQNLNRKINSFSYEDPQIRKIILDIAPEFSGNPREVKRFMNVFRFHYFLLSARQTQDPNIPSIEQLSRWILLSLKWPTVSRWLQGNVQALEKLEEFGRSCNNYVDWLKKIEADLRLKPDTFPDIFGEGVFFFFRREGNEIKEKEERLSSSSGKGMY